MILLNRLLIFCFTVVLLPSTAHAQHEWWITGGVNLDRYLVWENGQREQDVYYFKPGIQLGVSTRFFTGPTFQLETGAILVVRGSKLNYELDLLGYPYEYSGPTHVLYLELPIIARLSMSNLYKGLYFCGGVYGGWALYGVIKGSFSFRGEHEKVSEKLSFGFFKGHDDLRNYDAGVITGMGLNLTDMDLRFTYSQGLANISVAIDDGYKIKTNSMNLTVIFNFDMFKKKSKVTESIPPAKNL